MDRRQFLTLTAGLSTLFNQSVEAALSLDEVQSGMMINRDGQTVSEGTDFLKREDLIAMHFSSKFLRQDFSRNGRIIPPFKDSLAQEALQSIYLPIARTSTRNDLKWQVYLADDKEINAYTWGGGMTIVHSEAIKLCKSEAELAALLAHEIGHIEHKHMIRRLMSDEILQQFGLRFNQKIINEAYRRKSRGKEISLSDMIKISLDIFHTNYTRMWEHQADAFILKAFVETGYDLSLASLFCRNYIKYQKVTPGPVGLCLYSSHPEMIERVKRIESIANTLTNNRRPRTNSDEFRYLKDRIGQINV